MCSPACATFRLGQRVRGRTEGVVRDVPEQTHRRHRLEAEGRPKKGRLVAGRLLADGGVSLELTKDRPAHLGDRLPEALFFEVEAADEAGDELPEVVLEDGIVDLVPQVLHILDHDSGAGVEIHPYPLAGEPLAQDAYATEVTHEHAHNLAASKHRDAVLEMAFEAYPVPAHERQKPGQTHLTVTPHEGYGGKLRFGDAASRGEQLEHLHQHWPSTDRRL